MKNKILLFMTGLMCLQVSIAQQTKDTFTEEIEYLTYKPTDYANDTIKKWPLVIFLHGAGERGTDIEKIKVLFVECCKTRLSLFDNAVSPLLSLFENGLRVLVGLSQFGQRPANGFRINFPHDFADQLLLPAQRAVGADPLSFLYLLDQVVVRLDTREFLVAKLDELFAELL